MRLIQVSAFFHNDEPNGMGFTLVDQGHLEGAMAILRDEYSKMWAQAVRERKEAELAFDLRAQLYQFGTMKPGLTEEQTFIALANIWLLVEMGELKEDEFNGLQWVYGE